MKTFARNLWNQTEPVLKHSDARRQELSDLIDAFGRRVDAEQSYAKALESCSRGIEKYIREDSLASLTYSAFKFSSNNRAAEARNFAKQIRDEIIVQLKETLTKQTTESKSIAKEIRRQQKELFGLRDTVSRYSAKYSEYFRDNEDQIITNEVAMVLSGTPKDKKQKFAAKYLSVELRTKESLKEIKEYEAIGQQAVADYNKAIEPFQQNIEKGLSTLQEHQITRLDLQVDCIMKMLVFETSMVKNFEYDITNISQQMENGKQINDVLLFIEENQQECEPLAPLEVQLDKRMSKQTVVWLAEGKMTAAVEFHRNKDLREFIQQSFKHQQPVQLKGFEDTQLQKFSTLASIVWKCWEGEDITPAQITTFKELINDEHNRQMVVMCLQCYHLANKLELSEKGFDYCSKMLLTLFHKVRSSLTQCRETYDIYLLRRLIDMSFYYYKKEQMENPIQPNEPEGQAVQSSAARAHLERHYLFRNFEELPIISSRQFWECLIFVSVQEELFMLAQKPDLVQETQTVRERTTILGQLASFCHNMIMLGLPVKQVRMIIGRFCRIYDIPEDQDRDLSRSIAAAVKKYKEAKGSASFHDIP